MKKYIYFNSVFCIFQFIDERLDLLNSGRGFNDEFEVECNYYADRLGTGSGQRLKQQYREWAKTVKKEGGAFFKTVKDKVKLVTFFYRHVICCFYLSFASTLRYA